VITREIKVGDRLRHNGGYGEIVVGYIGADGYLLDEKGMCWAGLYQDSFEWSRVDESQADPVNHSGSKYLRDVQLISGKIDVYAVLVAFGVSCPARQHAIKKLLCAGLRGKGDELQDLRESIDAVRRAIEIKEAGK
jgi:hypothetical protein